MEVPLKEIVFDLVEITFIAEIGLFKLVTKYGLWAQYIELDRSQDTWFE